MRTVSIDPRGKIGLPADIGEKVVFKTEEEEITLVKTGKEHQAWEDVKEVKVDESEGEESGEGEGEEE